MKEIGRIIEYLIKASGMHVIPGAFVLWGPRDRERDRGFFDFGPFERRSALWMLRVSGVCMRRPDGRRGRSTNTIFLQEEHYHDTDENRFHIQLQRI